VHQGENTWKAQVAYLDGEHDLCGLHISGLNAKPVSLRLSSTLSVGDRLYALGAPEGLELSLSEGLVSGLRKFEGVTLIQTTAPISHGSSGGGLFDDEGRLVGITTFVVKDGQNLNFALPSERVANLSQSGLCSDSPVVSEHYTRGRTSWQRSSICDSSSNTGFSNT
jgi:serine protease Do